MAMAGWYRPGMVISTRSGDWVNIEYASSTPHYSTVASDPGGYWTAAQTQCEYCKRTQKWPEDGRCMGCGAPKPNARTTVLRGHNATVYR